MSTTGWVSSADELPVSTATAVRCELRTAVSQVWRKDWVASNRAIWACTTDCNWLEGRIVCETGTEASSRDVALLATASVMAGCSARGLSVAT